jgi:hypothetical protein
VTHDTIPDESRLTLYLSTRYLQELEVALQLAGVRTRYERPGVDGIELPRLVVEHPAFGWMNEVICALPLLLEGPNPQWWFEWRSFVSCRCPDCVDKKPERICVAKDMIQAARLIAEELREES